MSSVTDVILLTPLSDNRPAIERVNAWLEEHGSGALWRVDDHAGGPKAFQAEVWIGAYNYMDIPAFIAMLAEQDWRDPIDQMPNDSYDAGEVQLFLKDEHWEQFKLWTIAQLRTGARIDHA